MPGQYASTHALMISAAASHRRNFRRLKVKGQGSRAAITSNIQHSTSNVER
jgi:hypothetical protein